MGQKKVILVQIKVNLRQIKVNLGQVDLRQEKVNLVQTKVDLVQKKVYPFLGPILYYGPYYIKPNLQIIATLADLFSEIYLYVNVDSYKIK